MSEDLFEAANVAAVKERLKHLRSDSERLWGTMTPAQALAHCTAGLELALGERRPPRMLIGRILGAVIKRFAFAENEPMRRNSPTVPSVVVSDERDLDIERELLTQKLEQFASAGPAGCTAYPHSFFGRLTPKEWSAWMYKHLDHHLRQFGV